MSEMEWKFTGAGNMILNCNGFIVSYNPDCSAGVCGVLDKFLGLNQTEETALIVGESYLILDGDHRKEYEERCADLSRCLQYFNDHSDLISPTSDSSSEVSNV